MLVELLPNEPEVSAFAALVRFAEARRPARLDPAGVMVPLSEQDPVLWRCDLLDEAQQHLAHAYPERERRTARVIQAVIHAQWCGRRSLAEPPPWPQVLALYDELLRQRDDAFVRLNRAVALAEVAGPSAALAEILSLNADVMPDFGPYHAVRADLLRRPGRLAEAKRAYGDALALNPGPAERLWLERRLADLPA